MAAGMLFNSTLPFLINFNISEFSSTAEESDMNEIFSDVVFVFICFVGILGNSVAVIILSASSSIRKSRPYTLLVNQCLMDILTSVSGEVSILAKYTLKQDGMRGIVDQLLCNLIHNQLGVAVNSCASSYNLAALSIERMFSVVGPIRHRISFTSKNMKRAAVAIWLFSFLSIISHSVGTNGIASNGSCDFWKTQPGAHAKVFAVTFNLTISIVPLMTMVTCNVVMYARIMVARLKVKMNVIRVLGTCVLLFFVCHAPHVTLSILSRYGRTDLLSKPIFNVSLALLIANNIVNPVVYLLQYGDYNREFRKQLSHVFGCKKSIVDPRAASVSNFTSRRCKDDASNVSILNV